MTVSFESTICASCGTKINEASSTLTTQRNPCESCGSLVRSFSTHIHESLTTREKTGMKIMRSGYKKPIYESVSGDDLHRDTGQWNKLTREIDRENNRYKEVITNPENGEVLRQCDEPLTAHFNRGSAKPKPSGEF